MKTSLKNQRSKLSKSGIDKKIQFEKNYSSLLVTASNWTRITKSVYKKLFFTRRKNPVYNIIDAIMSITF